MLGYKGLNVLTFLRPGFIMIHVVGCLNAMSLLAKFNLLFLPPSPKHRTSTML